MCQKRTFDETQFAFSSDSFCQLQSNMPKTALREVRPARLECRLKKPWMIAHGIEFLLVCTTPRGFLDCFNLV
jgi:hypothetical protein